MANPQKASKERWLKEKYDRAGEIRKEFGNWYFYEKNCAIT